MKPFWKKRAPPMFRGVHRRFDEVRRAAGIFDGAAWREALAHDVRSIREGTLWDELDLEHEALQLIVRVTMGGSGVRILDFGGGAGISYAWLRRRLPDAPIQYHVVELPAAIEVGEQVFAEDRGISFSRTIDDRFAWDIVFVRSALQYVAQWRETARGLFGTGAQYVILEKFSGVTCASYATEQLNVAGYSAPYWFIAFDELFDVASRAGYRRVLWRRLPRIYDQSSFPPALRMGQASTIVFAKEG